MEKQRIVVEIKPGSAGAGSQMVGGDGAIRPDLAAYHERGPFSYPTVVFRFQPPPSSTSSHMGNVEGPMALLFQFPSD